MIYVIVGLVMFFAGWKLGRRYQDFQDIMLARRVAKLVSQREQLQKDQSEYEKWMEQDARIGRVRKKVMEVADND